MADFAPVHPGEILFTEFMRPMKLSQNGLAKSIQVPPRRINEIVHGKRAISAETALKLSQALGLSETFWVNMQAHYDAELAKDKLGDSLRRIPRIDPAPATKRAPVQNVPVKRAAAKRVPRKTTSAPKIAAKSTAKGATARSSQRGRSR
ncbi:MAG TPA: HigA family addiction module antitoxin [Candidatus Baltobacteraceae bacterium]|nr:HigA family addiction module antitoxin [Candidatus Baltobacteraceae bacterium]